jgi:hypothetical protein
MPSPANTSTTYGLRGIKEDVDGKIYTLDAEDTPFASSLAAEKQTQRVHQWQENVFTAPNKDNALIEGDDHSGAARPQTFILANTFQTLSKQFVVSNLANAVDKYGRENESSFQKMNAMMEIKRDCEAALLSNNVSVTGSSVLASKTAGIELFATQNALHGAGGSTAALTNATAPTTAPTDGTTRAFTAALFGQALSAMWEVGAKPKVAFMTMGQKNVFNAFPSIAQNRVDVAPKGLASIIGSVDIYSWDTGPIAIVPVYGTRLRSRTVIISDGESCKRTYLRPIQSIEVAPTGDSKKTMIVTDIGLKVTNRNGICKIADLL